MTINYSKAIILETNQPLLPSLPFLGRPFPLLPPKPYFIFTSPLPTLVVVEPLSHQQPQQRQRQQQRQRWMVWATRRRFLWTRFSISPPISTNKMMTATFFTKSSSKKWRNSACLPSPTQLCYNMERRKKKEEEEEELEWISNRDAFPSIETTFDMNHQSPVSVLSATVATLSNSISYSTNSISFPVQAKRSKRKRSMKGSWGLFQLPFKNRASTTSSLTEVVVRKCTHCSAERTPQWRAGPMGPKTLCNACGVRFKSGRLVPEYRPTSSPSFSSGLHSNSHKRIMEMRRKKHKGNNVQFTLKRN
ncbi:hypothetical protein Sjap_008708 [Stephania japonica]|uniref:GATA-type domain-containing protein n=1 Tax=Stephania japonica TaxID=461633 RepID=A0AAP0PCL8_9MAGN